jgi:hypothetical protein
MPCIKEIMMIIIIDVHILGNLASKVGQEETGKLQ